MISTQLSKFAIETKLQSLSEDIKDAAKTCLLDFCGAAIAGHEVKASQIAIEFALQSGGVGDANILGTKRKISASYASFVNGILSSCLDIDDGHRLAVGHPGVVVIPAALAIAQQQGSSGSDLLEAIIVGYEIAIRCGTVLNSDFSHLFYGSGGWAIYGAAAAAGKLLRLNEGEMRHALGICEVFGPRAQCLKSIANGSMTKESIGWGSMTAVDAAYLAQLGFTGPSEVLDEKGFYDPESLAILETLGNKYEIKNLYFKQFSSCKWSHSPIEAALEIRTEHDLDYHDIANIEVKTFSHAASLCHKRPESSESAQYSIPFTVANALVYGQVGPQQVRETNLSNPIILGLADLVNIVIDPSLEKEYPQTRPAIVKITTVDGQVFVKKISVVKGDSDRAFTKEELEQKFKRLSEARLSTEKIQTAIDLVNSIESQKNMAHLIDALAFN